MRRWKGFWQLADPKIWIASTVPMAAAGALAYSRTGKFEFFWFLISLIGIYLLEIGKNAVNEVMDYLTGVDRFVSPDKRTPFSGGKKTIVDNKLTVLETVIIAILTIAGGCVIGIYLMIFREPLIFFIGILGVFFSIFYSLPPFKFAYRGLGELVVGLTFGPLILSGMYLILTGTLDIFAIAVSLPIGFLIANVLWINQYPDYEADLQGNKRNWVVRMGKKKGVIVYAALYILAYLMLLLLSIIFRNPFWLVGYVGLPLAVKSIKIAHRFYNNISVLVEANAKTVIVYQITGAAIVLGALTNKLFIPFNLY
ncbi:MAG: prenyltransferase [Clostridiaceae bacterium]|nr:prenyltransferase [Clostridiaceae bacterium]